MAREKKPVHKVRMTEGKRNIIHQLLEEYDIQTAEDIKEALKDLLGGTIGQNNVHPSSFPPGAYRAPASCRAPTMCLPGLRAF